MVIETKSIDNFIQLQERIELLFADSILEKKRYAEAIGMNRQTLAKRLKNKSFTADELFNLVNEINKTFDLSTLTHKS